jgi:hypothetical protein
MQQYVLVIVLIGDVVTRVFFYYIFILFRLAGAPLSVVVRPDNGVIFRFWLSRNVTWVLSISRSGLSRRFRVTTLCIFFFYWVSDWTDQGDRGHRFVSLHIWSINVKVKSHLVVWLLLATITKYFFWRVSVFLLKLWLNSLFHPGSIENTTTETETKAAIVPQKCRVKRGGAFKISHNIFKFSFIFHSNFRIYNIYLKSKPFLNIYSISYLCCAVLITLFEIFISVFLALFFSYCFITFIHGNSRYYLF